MYCGGLVGGSSLRFPEYCSFWDGCCLAWTILFSHWPKPCSSLGTHGWSLCFSYLCCKLPCSLWLQATYSSFCIQPSVWKSDRFLAYPQVMEIHLKIKSSVLSAVCQPVTCIQPSVWKSDCSLTYLPFMETNLRIRVLYSVPACVTCIQVLFEAPRRVQPIIKCWSSPNCMTTMLLCLGQLSASSPRVGRAR